MACVIDCVCGRSITMLIMKHVISTLVAWSCIVIILAADSGNPLALRLEGAAAVIVGITTIVLALGLFSLGGKAGLTAAQKEWRAEKWPRKTYRIFMCLAWLAVLAWVGWLWAFGVRLAWVIAWSAVMKNRDA